MNELMLNVKGRRTCGANLYKTAEIKCGVLRSTCPTGGQPSLSSPVLDLHLGLAEGELQTGLGDRWWLDVETIREI